MKINEYPWARSVERLQDELESIPGQGLSSKEVQLRFDTFGPNSIADSKPLSGWKIWWRQFRSLIVGLLIVAAVISGSVGDWPECIAVLVVVIVNAFIGFFTELRAVRSMSALKKMGETKARVVRDSKPEIISSKDLVPGDYVVLEAGDMVPADLRIVQASSLKSDESALTGESLPIQKTTEALAVETPLAERKSMLYRGAKITAGTGAGLVVGTGEQSELGKISNMVKAAKHHTTPLEKQLDRLGYRLVWVTLLLMAILTLFGWIRGIDLLSMIQTSIALAIAAIPEGLPIVATIALANGLWKMAKKNAIINQLSAVETLGSTGIICTDKTGTLTENKMTVAAIWPAGSGKCLPATEFDQSCQETVAAMAQISRLCNNAQIDGETAVGDPLEVALLEWVDKLTIEQRELIPRTLEIPFDADVRRMTTIHRIDDQFDYVAVKGAASALTEINELDADVSDNEWLSRNQKMAEKGLRVIALAEKTVASKDTYQANENLKLVGLVGLIDPARPEVAEAIKECQNAGIRIVMITGDQAPTAVAVADEIGIEDGAVFTGSELEDLDFSRSKNQKKLLNTRIIARATPAQKLALVEFYQSKDQIVAMTGDGVNDAPALKQADIGVAMGVRGTDVAREAAAMVLQDDSFSSIVVAVRQGRIILSNIRKFVIYLMSCNLSEILVVWIAMMFTNQLPLLPLQILFLNLVTDVFPALALGVTPGNQSLMQQKPRTSGERILTHKHWIRIGRFGLLISASTLGAYFVALNWLGMETAAAVTISFLTLAVAQLFHVFNMAQVGGPFFTSEVVKNPWVWKALALCMLLLALACYVPPIAKVLSLRAPDIIDISLVITFGFLPVLVELITRKVGEFCVGK